MRRFVILPILLNWLAQAQPGKVPPAVVEIRVWDASGYRIEGERVTLTPVGGGDDYNASGKKVELSVPPGEYILRVQAPGFEARREILRVYEPRVLRSIALQVAPPHGAAFPSLKGKVVNYGGNVKDLRIRLMALYGDGLREARVDARGSFAFPTDNGAFLLVTVADLSSGIAILDIRPLRIVGAEAVTVNLKGKTGELITRIGP